MRIEVKKCDKAVYLLYNLVIGDMFRIDQHSTIFMKCTDTTYISIVTADIHTTKATLKVYPVNGVFVEE